MKAILGIQWLMILAISALWTQDIAADDDFITAFVPEINAVLQEYVRLAYLIQDPHAIPPPNGPFHPVKICVVSEDELKEISSVIEDAGKDNNNPPIEIVKQSSCSELEKIKLGIFKLKHDFNQLVKKQVSSTTYEELKRNYEEKLRQLQKEMDDAVKNASAQEKATIDKLCSDLQSQEVRIKSILRQLEEKQKNLNEVSVRLCVSELKQKRIDAAVDAYRNLSDKSKMKDIILSAYENADSFQILFDFIGRAGVEFSGYMALFEKIKSYNHLNSINVLKLTNAIVKNRGPSIYANMLEDALKVMHRNNNFDDFFSYAYKKRDDGSFELDEDIILIFVRTAYNNDRNNVENILDMQGKFYYLSDQLHLINSLITIMRNKGDTNKPEFLMVVKKVVDLKDYVDKYGKGPEKDIVVQMYKNVPEILRPLLSPNLCIRNVVNNEYMHAGNAADDARRYIFTSIKNKFDDTFNFEIEFLDRGRKMLIKNSHYNEHLYSMDGGPPRKLLSWMKGDMRNDSQAYFTIEVVDYRNVRIKNLRFNEYVYSPESDDKYDDNERGVYTRSQITRNSLWRLSTCQLQ